MVSVYWLHFPSLPSNYQILRLAPEVQAGESPTDSRPLPESSPCLVLQLPELNTVRSHQLLVLSQAPAPALS